METTSTTTRIDQFKSDIADMKLKTGTSSKEGVLQIVGVLLMIAGIVIAFASYNSSLNQNDARDIQSYTILAIGGLTLTIAGAAMFLRYAIAKFLRFWLLRQMYEGQAHIDQVVDAIRER
jgi:hypothetical protein